MPLKLTKRSDSNCWYLRGTVRGIAVYETTGTSDRAAAEAIRVTRQKRLLDESVHGKRATVTFLDAALSYLESRGSPGAKTYLGSRDDHEGRWTGLIGHFRETKLLAIGQSELDAAARKLLPN